MLKARAVELWRDELGAASSLSYLLLVTILGIGIIVGLTSLRDQVVQELGDLGLALESLNQSYTIPGSTFTDLGTAFPTSDNTDAAPGCLSLSVNASAEQ